MSKTEDTAQLNVSNGDWASGGFDVSIKECFLTTAALVFIGTVSFSFIFEQWDVADSMYFSIITLTTVGYGDLCPSTPAGRIFVSFYAIFGIAAIGIYIGILGSNIVNSNIISLEKTKKDADKAVLNNTDVSKASIIKYEYSSGVSQQTLERCVLILAFLLGGAFYVSNKEVSSWIQQIYYFVITSSTVGYGDFHLSQQQTQNERLFSMLYIFVSVMVMGEFLGAISGYVLEKRQAKFYASLKNRQINFEDLKRMDTNVDGKVTELEYMVFMLKSMDKVDDSFLQLLKTKFKNMDVIGDGVFSVSDLKKLASIRKNKSIAS